MTNGSKIFLTLLEVAGINEPPRSQKHKLIKECNDIAAGLVNRENYSTIVVTGQRNETFDDVIRVICIKAACGFVQEEYRWGSDKLAGDGHTAFFATGYGPTSCRG